MGNQRVRRDLIVVRRYEAQEEECAKALKVLLKRTAGKIGANGDDDVKLANKERRPA